MVSLETSAAATAAAADDHGEAPSWTASTNWTVASGSISSSVAVESSFSPIDDGSDNGAKSPLILYPSSPDSSSCEITIMFSQRHEVRQVYVRSTARFYEMYYANKHGSSNEYLSTVRCGIAEREGHVLMAPGVDEAVLAHQRSCVRGPNGGGLGNGTNLTSNEDDWVEVKATTDSSQPLRQNVSPSRICDAATSSLPQVLYEATAEIADANPCMSFTLKLLSLVNKGCVCVEEVYVFADPVDVDDLDNQVGPGENTSGNSLMAMLVPTILQLSKSKALGLDNSNIATSGKQKLADVGLKQTDPINAAAEIKHEDASGSLVKQEAKLPDTIVSSVFPVQPGISQHRLDFEDKLGKRTRQPEGVLDQLISHVNRIENLLLRFEDRMLKPLSNIDDRLRRVERQLETLTNKTENSEQILCTRICAPEFSCGESESNSLYNSGCVDSGYVACEENKDLPTSSDPSEIPISVDTSRTSPSLQVPAPEFSNDDNKDLPTSSDPPEIPISVDASKTSPSLQVSAPEFSNDDNEDEDLATETVNKVPADQKVHALSIDDALASALAGFLTAASVPSQKHTVAVKAPEFSTEDESNYIASASPRGDPCILADSFACSSDCERAQEYTFPTGSNGYSFYSDENVMKSSSNENKQKTVDEGGESRCSHDIQNTALPGDVGADHLVDVMNNAKADTLTDNSSDHDKTGSLKEISGTRMADAADATQEITTLDEPVAFADITECRSNQDSFDNIVGFARFASIPNYFDSQILDVKFVSHENLNTKSSLEALLSETSDLNVETPDVEETGKDDPDAVEQGNLIPIEDLGTANGLISVDMDYYSVRDTPRDVEADNLKDTHERSSRKEISAESLI